MAINDSTDVVLLTESRYLHPVPASPYINNIFLEDRLLRTELESRSLTVRRVDWADPQFDWSSAKAVIFRTPWDYFENFPKFSGWLDHVKTKTRLINPIELIRWNIDKHYLNDLSGKGIRIPPTLFIEPGSKETLAHLLSSAGWDEAVVKPAIAGGARHTYRITRRNCEEHEEIFQELIRSESMLIQPFLQNIITQGEVSLMVMNGTFTHSIIKRAIPGDFRVQDDFGGTVHPYDASDEERRFAERVVRACDPLPLYARVDVINDDSGTPVVSELEIIEPELWFRFHPPAASKLAGAVADSL